MSKSLEFCVQTASDPTQSAFAHRDWSKAIEHDSEPFFDERINGNRSLYVDIDTQTGEAARYGMELTIDPDGDFSYFTSANFVTYGELDEEELKGIILANFEDCVNRVMSIGTYDSYNGRPQDGNTIHYTVGNFVLLCERNAEKNRNEITVLLPIKTNILREGIL